MNELVLSVKGIGGELEVYSNKVIIKRKGFLAFLNHGFKGDKTIFIKDISGIQLKEGGVFTNGYIQFSFLGGQESKGGIFQAAKDENSLVFYHKQNDEMKKAKQIIEEKKTNL